MAKEKVHSASGEVVHRVVFVHNGDSLVAEQSTIDDPSDTSAGHPAIARRGGLVWVTDPATGELLGQITLTASKNSALVAPVQGRWSGSGAAGASIAPQHKVEAVFHVMLTDLASAPRELIDPDAGKAADRVVQSLYGRRTWHGEVACPLLFAGQYEDAESGWLYNRFRYYDPTAGIYSAQDPLGVTPRLAGVPGYVDDAVTTTDPYGPYSHRVSAPSFVHTMHNKGVVGEYAADSIIKRNGGTGLGNLLTYEDSFGVTRISDERTANGLIEVKNVKSQSMTAQPQAAVDKSSEMGGKLDLYIAPETKFSNNVANHEGVNIIRMERQDIVRALKDDYSSPAKSIFTY